jgi:hypothetical protein
MWGSSLLFSSVSEAMGLSRGRGLFIGGMQDTVPMLATAIWGSSSLSGSVTEVSTTLRGSTVVGGGDPVTICTLTVAMSSLLSSSISEKKPWRSLGRRAVKGMGLVAVCSGNEGLV